MTSPRVECLWIHEKVGSSHQLLPGKTREPFLTRFNWIYLLSPITSVRSGMCFFLCSLGFCEVGARLVHVMKTHTNTQKKIKVACPPDMTFYLKNVFTSIVFPRTKTLKYYFVIELDGWINASNSWKIDWLFWSPLSTIYMSWIQSQRFDVSMIYNVIGNAYQHLLTYINNGINNPTSQTIHNFERYPPKIDLGLLTPFFPVRPNAQDNILEHC